MTKRDEIIKFCEEYLKVSEFEDACVNGLQIEGVSEVKKIVTGVSISEDLIKKAVEKNAQMLLVHHGIFDKNMSQPFQLKNYWRNRLKFILENNLNLAGFHLPLDAHREIGNCVSLCNKLEVKDLKEFFVGFVGELKEEMDLGDFVKFVNEKLDTNSYVVQGGPQKVKKIGVISGAYPGEEMAKEAGADTYLTGEIKESSVKSSEELGINYISAGHYNTEKDGIYNLGELIKKEFGVEHEFLDIPCDI